MSTGIKHDSGKPQLDMISYEFLEEMAYVRAFGAEKYTIYGDCDCVQNVKENQFTQNNYVNVVTTNNLKQKTQNTKQHSEKIIRNGQKHIERNSTNTTGAERGTTQPNDMDLPENKLTNSSTWDASFATKPSGYVSTTTTVQARFEEPYVSHVMSESDGLKILNGLSKHETTCNALKVVAHGRDNWRKGFKVTRSLAAALRHIFKFLSGETNDPESNRSHLAHAACALEHAIWDMKHHPENDDRYKK